MSGKRCLVLGSVNIDEVYEVPRVVKVGETLSSTKFTRGPGGKGANCAVAISQAGCLVDFAGYIGKDGSFLRDELEKYNVGTSLLKEVDIPTGRAIIQVTTGTDDSDADNCIILFPGANHNKESALPKDLSEYACLVLQNEIMLEHTVAAVHTAKSAKLPILYNPSPMLSAEQAAQFPWLSIDWLIVNKEELQVLSGVLDKDQHSQETDSGCILDSVFQRMDGKVNIVVTLGSKGALCRLVGDNNLIQVSAGRLLKPVVDTTGAGDTCTGYLAAFVAQLSNTLSAEGCREMLQISQQAAAMSVEINGAMPSVPKRAAVLARLNSHNA